MSDGERWWLRLNLFPGMHAPPVAGLGSVGVANCELFFSTIVGLEAKIVKFANSKNDVHATAAALPCAAGLKKNSR